MNEMERTEQIFKNYKDAFETEEDPYWRMQYLAEVVMIASDAKISLPNWALDVLNNGLKSWSGLRVATLDEAFEMEPASKRQFNERINRQIGWAVKGDIIEAERQGVPIPWEDLAKKYKKSKTALQDYYYKNIKPIVDGNPFTGPYSGN